MINSKRILVISPHTDDELFGCGGTLLKLKKDTDISIKLVVMSCSNRYLNHLNRTITTEEQWDEFKKCATHLSTEKPEKFKTEKRLEEYPMYLIVEWLDRIISQYKPTTILIPEPSYHQEHQLTYKAAIAACRPTYGKSKLENIFLYEIPTNTWSGAESFYKPNVYIDISSEIDNKIELFKEAYKVQYTKEKRNMLGEQGILAHAKYRGVESGHDCSESFMLIKSVRENLV